MDKKTPTCFTMLLSAFCIITFAQTAAAFPVEVPTTYYVDDNCPDEVQNGTIDDPFCTIQAGIDAANAEDTVEVAAGIYYENMCDNGDFFDDWDIAMAGFLAEEMLDEEIEKILAERENEPMTMEKNDWLDEEDI